MECEACGKEFQARPYGKNRFCSRQCTGVWRRGDKWGTDRHTFREAVCEQCGREFMSRIDSYGRFCSRQCSGKWHTGHANGNYKGSQWVHGASGRWVVRCRDGSYLFYYRAVAAAMLGRELRPDEVVHHIDGDPTNDDPANLAVMSQVDHAHLHHPRQPEKPHSRARPKRSG